MSTLNATFPCLMVIFAKGEELDNPQYVHLHNEDDARRMYARFEEKHKANGWHCTAAVHYYSTEYTATAEEHHADVDACLAEPNSSAAEPKPTYEQLEAKIERMDAMQREHRLEKERAISESMNPDSVRELLELKKVLKKLVAERRAQITSLKHRLIDQLHKYRRLRTAARKAVVPHVSGEPVMGMTFPFTLDTAHRDTVELTVTGVDIVDGKHRVHMTADIRLPEAQPQQVPSPVVEPTFVEVRDVPGVVTQLSLDLVAPPPAVEPPPVPSSSAEHRSVTRVFSIGSHLPVWEAPTPSGFTPPAVGAYTPSLDEKGNTVGRSQDHSNLLAYEQAGASAVADEEDAYFAAALKEAAKATTLTFGGVTIGVDGDMLFLTDMWKAAGSDDSKKPARWRALPGAQEFIEFIEESVIGKSDNESFRTVRGGADQGTWAHWQLGMAYAKYLSPSFHAWCNSVVRAHMLGRVAPATPASFVEPKATMDWHKYSMEMHKQAMEVHQQHMEREKEWYATTHLLEVKNSKTIALLKAENDGQAEVITAQYNELTEYKDFFAGGDSGVSTVALNMGYNEQFFFSLMREHGLIVSGRTAGWSYGLQTDPYKEYIDKGWFVVRPNLPHRRRHPFTGKMEVKQSSTTLITNLGWLNLYRMYGEHGTHWHRGQPAHLFPISPCNRRITAEELDNYRRKLWAMWTKEALAQGMRYADIPPYPTQKDEDE